jgi:cellulose synthase/poly-beta-1,6-N-acetylglucosamine synthase-like glycosyltransferase
MIVLEGLVMFLYFASLLFIFGYGLSQLHLVWLSRRFYKKPTTQKALQQDLPFVSIQLPVFNERYVIERLIDAVAAIDWPKDKFEIQVLDDSTDDSFELAEEKISYYQERGFNIRHIHRTDRKGFKAGALAHGLEMAQGEFIAIFDADFVPKPDFLKKTIPHFSDDNTAVVQTRWGHLNKEYSLLTKLQAFGLDTHFLVEQTGRKEGGYFLNFNGTAGIWRKKAILDAGGWKADTLTEDLDLSYRAQLKGWKIEFLPHVVAPAELPMAMPAVKSQQFRWTKGAAETSRILLVKLWKSTLPISTKIHGSYHLLNSTIFICIVLTAVLSMPILWIRNHSEQWSTLIQWSTFFLLGYFFLILFYWAGFRKIHGSGVRVFIKFMPRMFMLLSIFLGLSVHNAIAVTEGWIGKKSPFIRTPKFNIDNTASPSWRQNLYLVRKLGLLTFIEGLLAIYFGFGIYMAFQFNDFALFPFHVLLTLGFFLVFYFSINHRK